MFYNILFNKQKPKWFIFVFDLFISFFSILLAFQLRFNFDVPERFHNNMLYVSAIAVAVRAIIFLLTKSFAGIIRYTGTKDSLRVMLSVFLGSLVFSVVNLVSYIWFDGVHIIPFSIIIIDFITCSFVLVLYRVVVKITYLEMNNPSSQKQDVVIFGAGEAGVIAKRSIDRDAGSKYRVLGFVDDDPKKVGKKIEDVKIYAGHDLNEILKTHRIAHLILSVQKIMPDRKREIIESCLKYNTKVLNVPPVTNWINGELSFKQIKKINIDDLLEREPIKLDEIKVRQDISGKVVLVTGAAGSIGSEIARQLAGFKSEKLILLDQAESHLFYLELELSQKYPDCDIAFLVGDIRNASKMKELYDKYHPSYVYHVAAYKHVPLMERNPDQAVQTNIMGTKIMADLAVQYQVQKFVMVSTDKAVNPTNVMGATKRIAEMYVRYLNASGPTLFITTRFGNVLGSNGSVITLFKKQIEKGEPLTITHPEVTRYFMTIPEACQLVLEAGAMGKGGEIFLFDMGVSVKIVDLAKKMIKLSGLTLGKDIQIVFTGLRPGEKLYEELLCMTENAAPTYHPRIMIAKDNAVIAEETKTDIENLMALAFENSTMEIVRTLKKIAPEFISQNSIYEQLDNHQS